MVAHLAVGRDDDGQLARPRVELDVVERHDVGRVGGRDGEPLAVLRHDQDAAAVGDGAGEQPDGVGDDEGAAEVDQRQAERLGEGLGDLPLGGEAAPDDDLPEPLAGLARLDVLLRHQRGRQLLLGEDALLDEHLAQAPSLAGQGGVRGRGAGRSGRHGRCIGR